MFIAVDGISTALPADVKALTAQSTGGRRTVDRGGARNLEFAPAAPQASAADAEGSADVTLDRWDVQSHQYTTTADVEASILARLFSTNAHVSSYGIVQEAKRFCILTSDTGRRVEFGTAVRLSVAVLATKFEAALTLPNVAAKAQLSNLRARIALSVDGYVGPLGGILPAPDNLNVENLAVYTTAFKAIQAEVFGAPGLSFLSPTLLGYDEERNGEAEA